MHAVRTFKRISTAIFILVPRFWPPWPRVRSQNLNVNEQRQWYDAASAGRRLQINVYGLQLSLPWPFDGLFHARSRICKEVYLFHERLSLELQKPLSFIMLRGVGLLRCQRASAHLLLLGLNREESRILSRFKPNDDHDDHNECFCRLK